MKYSMQQESGNDSLVLAEHVPGTILNLLLDCFLFERLQLSSQLFGLIPKSVEALSQ
jgi:hypothetical protein